MKFILVILKEDLLKKQSNMKPFNIELAKAGHPVCTRGGHKARIVCFDRKAKFHPIVALIEYSDDENVVYYTNDGTNQSLGAESQFDLMMATVKKEGWVNLYQNEHETWTGCDIFDTKEDALYYCDTHDCFDKKNYIKTIKIEWEE